MLKKYHLLLLFLSLITTVLLISGCAPASWNLAQKSYQQGDIVGAVRYSAQTLREKPNYGKAVAFLRDELPRTYDGLLQKAKNAESAKNWDDAHQFYKTIKTLSDLVASLPRQTDPQTKISINFQTKDVNAEITKSAENAAEKHYQDGLSLEKGGKNKDAAKKFSKAMEFISGYKDAAERYERCRAAAVKRVAVMAFSNISGKEQYGPIGELIADQVITTVMNDPRNMEFMDFVTRERLDQLIAEQKLGKTGVMDEATATEMGKVLGIHAFVFGKVKTIIVNFPPETKTVTTESKEYSQGENLPTLKVSATVYTTTRKGSAKISCSYQIIDVASGKISKSGTSEREKEVVIKFGRFTGDERALSSTSKSLCSKEEEALPSGEELVNQAADYVSRALADEIAAFFR